MRGSITVFATLVMMLVGQFLFTLAEAGRFLELDKVAAMDSESNIESVFAQYCKPLWDEYNLLLYDCGKESELDINGLEKYLQMQCDNNFAINTDGKSNNTSLLRLNTESVNITQYTLMTDAQGEVFARSVSSYMERNFAYEAAKKIYSNYQSVKSITENSGYEDAGEVDRVDTGNLNKQNGFMLCTSSTDVTNNNDFSDFTGEITVNDMVVENPLVSIKEAKAGGVLNLVLSEDKVSGNKIDLSDSVSERKLNTGKNPVLLESDWYDSVLVEQYLLSYMSCYTEPIENHAMKYELEYLIGGDATDKDNLTAVVDRLLMIRGGIDFAYLCTDSKRQAEALVLATAIATAMLNPELAEVIKWAILAGWAFVESVLDVRALLSGDKVPLMKSNDTWTSGLLEIPTLLCSDKKAKSSDIGLNYKAYLGILLLFNGTQTQAYRAMDMQEATIRMTQGYEMFRMDNGICQLSVDFNYKYHGLFISFISLINIGSNEFHIGKNQKYSYYK